MPTYRYVPIATHLLLLAYRYVPSYCYVPIAKHLSLRDNHYVTIAKRLLSLHAYRYTPISLRAYHHALITTSLSLGAYH